MTSPHHQPTASPSPAPAGKDWVHRSTMGIASGVLICAIIGWLGGDALVHGEPRLKWLVLAGSLLTVPLVVAFTLRPAVFVNDGRLRVRNPFRMITLPWGRVSGLRSGYSNEVFTEAGDKYQLWAIPVSLRARKRANRRQAQISAQEAAGGAAPARTFGTSRAGGAFGDPDAPVRAETDKIMDDLRELHEGHHDVAEGEITVRWAYEILVPALVGAIALAVLLATG